MKAVKVQITKYISDEPQPGIVEFRLIDAWNREWIFVEKTAVVTCDELDENSPYPQHGTIACEIVEMGTDVNGREIVTVNTESPWHITEETGESLFQVLSSQIIDE